MVIGWCFSLPIPTAAKWSLFVPFAVIVPVAMYHAIEHRLIQFGENVPKRFFSPRPETRLSGLAIASTITE
jgi:hypothetical protein